VFLIIKWLAIALLLFIGCTPAQNAEVTQTSTSPPAIVTPSSPPLKLSPPNQPPAVGQQQLVRHLKAIVGERYFDADRDRTRNYLIRSLKQFGWQVTTQSFGSGVNVIARQAMKPNQKTLLVVAHYDTVPRSPGADDNATSVAATLEVARLLQNHAGNQALAIVLFDQEEQGLLGSSAFVAKPDNIKNLVGVINLEMMGYTCNTPGCQTYPAGLPITPPGDRGDFLGIVADQEHAYLLQAFQLAHTADLPPIITVPIPFKGLLTPDVLRSDHAPFWARNIGAVMLGDTANFRNPNYHQPSDTLDTLDLDFFARSTQLVINAAIVLLDAKTQ